MEIEFEIVGELRSIETIATGRGIRILAKLNRLYGSGSWRKLKGGCRMVRLPKPKFIGSRPWNRQASYEHQAPRRLNMSERKRFAVCIRNDEYEASLELRKIYDVLEDFHAEGHQMLRVIDEEGEDDLYPASWFMPIEH